MIVSYVASTYCLQMPIRPLIRPIVYLFLCVCVTAAVLSHLRSSNMWMLMKSNIRSDASPERTHFRFYLNQEKTCKERHHNDVKLLIVVYVAVGEVTERNFIRKRWGRYARENLNCRLIFLLGKPRDGDTTELEMEYIRHQDIVAADFTDTYRNLTLKSFAMFQWVAQFCHQAQYVLKIDSDVEINVSKLLYIIETGIIPDKFNCGRVRRNAKVNRKDKKWYVSRSDYNNDIYPHYCIGSAYMMPRRLIEKLSTIHIPFKHPFPVDDAYITGILRKEINEEIDTRLFSLREDKRRSSALHRRKMIHVVFKNLWQFLHCTKILCIVIWSHIIKCIPLSLFSVIFINKYLSMNAQ